MISIDLIDARTPQSIWDICCTTTKKINWFCCKLNQEVVKAQLLFSSFLADHNLPLRTANHAAKLFRNKFRDSKIVNKYRCGHTRTKHMLNEQITSHLNKELLLTRWYGSAGNGMSDEDDNFLPVLDKDSELITTSLLDRPNIKSGSY